MENAERMGTYLRTRMRDWPARFPNVGDVRGLGLMIGIELVRDQATKERALELRDRVVQLAISNAACWCLARASIRCGSVRRWWSRLTSANSHLMLRSASGERQQTNENPSTWAAGFTNSPVPSESTGNPASRADVLVDLDRFLYPFADGSFDRSTAIHVIEHVDDVIGTMEEFHRLARPGGTVHRDPSLHRFQFLCDPTP